MQQSPKLINIILAVSMIIPGACRKFVQVDPPTTKIVSNTVFQNDATALSAIDGIYSKMMSGIGFASGSTGSVTLLSGLSADEFDYYSSSLDLKGFYSSSVTTASPANQNYLWGEMYQNIYAANAVLAGVDNSATLSSGIKNRVAAQAKFIRAFCYFYLVNLYGDVPLILTTDYAVNKSASRAAQGIVYQQIVEDLEAAEILLPSDYSFSGNERIRPNKGAADALLARVYLYLQDWVKAESSATMVINNVATYNLQADLNNVFKKNNSEAIWQLLPVVTGSNTNEAANFVLTNTPELVALSQSLLSSFEPDDNRRKNWVGQYATYYYPLKYKVNLTGQPLTEYSMVLRLAEQYLIRAEARSFQHNITGAQQDINIIRLRAGLPATAATDETALKAAIAHERQVEFFTEWGHRWFDLKRTNQAPAVLQAVKGTNWQVTDVLYPVPQSEINNDIYLTQNAGY